MIFHKYTKNFYKTTMSFIFTSMLLAFSCSKTTQINQLSLDECEELSMMTFKAIPHAAVKFKDYCGQYTSEIKYTSEHCQKALNELILKGDQAYLEKNFGEKIMKCFTQNDLNSFLKK